MIFCKKLMLSAFVLLLLGNTRAATNPPIELKNGLTITTSGQVKRNIYFINGTDSLNKPVLLILGNNITIDFNEAVLMGSNDKELPNQFYGLAILIKGNNITIKNAKISGFKVAIMAEGCKNLHITSCNFSYNYRQHLQSNWMREDVSDWMSYHHNENDEWLRYGAGIYLKDCLRPTITANTITGGQCALMMMRCDEGLITDNDFSFNSAIGIGLYRSNRNNILHNKLDFNVRGYSDGFYFRGQDSAGILVFEQCNENVFAYNSVTHSGDGFFLWAGQTTMDNGQGGCNDNYLFKNDFSFAPTNGIEVTFSKNVIEQNIIKACDNGIWGGYSWQTVISGNILEKNRTGIAIEHGQNNAIWNNTFRDNVKDGIKLWARKTQPGDWGYAKKRDTRSINYEILDNRFENENNAFNATLTDQVKMDGNQFVNCRKALKTDSSVTNLLLNFKKLTDTARPVPVILTRWKQQSIPTNPNPKGRDQIRITEWGPYNYSYPFLFLKKIDSNNIYHFDLFSPGGMSNIKALQDMIIISDSGTAFHRELIAKKTGEDVQLIATYTGKSFIDQFGKTHQANKAYTFTFRDYQPDIDWKVNWYTWDLVHDPNKNYPLFKMVYNNAPVKSQSTKKIDYTWWGEIGKYLPADSFTTLATGTVNVKKGQYRVSVTADDLVKVFIDGNLVIDFWDATKYKNDEDAHHEAVITLNGKHEIRIEQVENSGYATLIFSLIPL